MTLYDDATNWALRPAAFPIVPADSSVIWVPTPDGEKPSLAYTLGLADRPGRAYEVAAFGLPLHLANSMILAAADQLARRHQDPAEGLEVEDILTGGYRARLRLVQDTAALEGIGEGVPVWQVVTSDRRGHFPGHPHHDPSDPYRQPLP